jgi:predicted Zn-dependent protease
LCSPAQPHPCTIVDCPLVVRSEADSAVGPNFNGEHNFMRTRVWGAWLAMAGAIGGCATNPVTGRSELSLVSESQEISMGQQAAAEVAQSIGLYNDAQAQTFVSNLGKRLAAGSERPQLPWSFQVVDDPAVNAFALPGGPIFVTRGIMTTLNSEAELASVLGHEIGHVTAKHSVQQISRAQLAGLGLGIGSILSDDVARFAGLASTGLGLLFLKYGRDAENQSDELGFKYAMQARYDVREMLDVFRTLERVGASSGGGGRLPEWLSTHPNPENRLVATQRRIDSVGTIPPNSVVGRDTYLQIIDNMVYGVNPRAGFFRGTQFLHPDLRFQLDFPQGWQTQNQTAAVVAMSPGKDAIVQLTLAGNKTPEQTNSEFFSQQGIRALQSNRTTVNGNPAVTTLFEAQTQDGILRGIATFLTYGGNTYQILGFTPAAKFTTYDNEFTRSIGSFRSLTDQAALNVQPMRIALVRVPRAMTVEQFYQQYPSPVPVEEIGLINDLQAGQTIAAGTTVKRVTGNKP